MTEPTSHAVDETMLSGYLDGELTQAAAQKVRLHLEDCAECRRLYEEIETMRDATRTTPFVGPPDDLWDERPRGTLSRIARNVGWFLFGAGAMAALVMMLREIAVEEGDWLGLLLFFSVFGGMALVFLSVLIDRLKTRTTDKYREVKK